MSRLVFAVILAASPLAAFAAGCHVSGTAYDVSGKPMRAVVRLVDMDSGQAYFGATDEHAVFAIDGSGGSRYRLDLVSAPTQVTGSHIPTRSIIGMSDAFACGGQLAHQDVHAQVD